jgi:hypothetical protein
MMWRSKRPAVARWAGAGVCVAALAIQATVALGGAPEIEQTGSGVGVEHLVVATSKTGTLQKELAQVGAAGYQIVGMTVGKTALGGNELVAITRRVQAQ